MAREVISAGKTVNDAIDAGCAQLGITREEAEFEIISLQKKGFLGLKNIPAKVRVFVSGEEVAPTVTTAAPKSAAPKTTAPKSAASKSTAELKETTEPKAAPDYGKKIETAQAYLQGILREIGLQDVTMTTEQQKDELIIQLEGEEIGIIIGRRGETLDAIQYLVGLAANRVEGDYLRVIINSGNFREKREKTLEALATRLAKTAVKTGRSNTLEPMNPYERRIIHAAVSKVEGAVSSSIGEEPNRCVVISSVNGKPRYSGNKEKAPYPKKSSGYHKRQGGGGRSAYSRSDRRENSGRSRTEEPKTIRQTPPTEANDQPLYSKIEIE